MAFCNPASTVTRSLRSGGQTFGVADHLPCVAHEAHAVAISACFRVSRTQLGIYLSQVVYVKGLLKRPVYPS